MNLKIKRFGIVIGKVNCEVKEMKRSLLYWRFRSFFISIKRIKIVKIPICINCKTGLREIETVYRLVIPIIKVKKACDAV